MIIQSLVSLYDRLAENNTKALPGPGYAEQKVSFAIILGDHGELVQIRDIRGQSGKKVVPEMLLLPSIERSGSGFSPQFMWDNTQYVLGAVPVDEKKEKQEDIEKKKQRAIEAFEAFRRFHHEYLDGCNLPFARTFLTFLDSWKPEMAEKLENWKDIAGANLVFMHGTRLFIHEEPEVRRIWESLCAKRDDGELGSCFLTGEIQKLARLHPMIKNVDGAQPKGAAIASFNNEAFCSYDKQQSYNAPLNSSAAFKYTAALNYLLRRIANQQRVKISDSTVVFWTERASPIENFFGDVLEGNNEAVEGADRVQLQQFLEAVRTGRKPVIPDFDESVKFYMLALAPNNSRLAVRFWLVCTVEQLMRRIGKHFKDMEMERAFEHDPLNPGIWELLRETARESKNISPVLNGALMRAILEGTPYPMPLYFGVLNRIRVEQKEKKKEKQKPKVSYLSAAILKAVLTRNYNMEVPMSLDESNVNVGYLLGRLFAVLEKLQRDAVGKVNSSIRDCYWGAASTAPASVFHRLINLSRFHIPKAPFGSQDEKIMEIIINNISEFPLRLEAHEQGMFAIGYYHQKNSFYKKNTNDEKGE